MIKAVLFDMDGVLVDAKEFHYEALNRALQLFGMEISRYEHLVTYDGLPTKKKLEMLSMERGLPVALHSFINEMKQEYTFELIHRHCRPIFAHQYALSRLKHSGFLTAVCSNSIKKTVELMMEKTDLIKFLDLMLSNQDVKNAKPHPEIYQKAITEFGLKPHEVVVVEDNPNGIRAAKDSGAHVLVVRDVTEVNWFNISEFINKVSGGQFSREVVG